LIGHPALGPHNPAAGSAGVSLEYALHAGPSRASIPWLVLLTEIRDEVDKG